jgi:hypothetical protein
VSPFEDYETWIKQADFLDYLQSYPGQPWPESKDEVDAAFKKLNPQARTNASNNQYKGKLKDQFDAAAKLYPQTPGAMVSVVSTKTVSASKATARSTVPGQAAQMGGSATTVSITWPHDRQVGACTKLTYFRSHLSFVGRSLRSE